QCNCQHRAHIHIHGDQAVIPVGGDTVHTLRITALLSVAMIAVACGKDSSKTALNGDLKRDLELAASSATDLASAQAAAKFSPSEIAPATAPVKSPTLKKSSGP